MFIIVLSHLVFNKMFLLNLVLFHMKLLNLHYIQYFYPHPISGYNTLLHMGYLSVLPNSHKIFLLRYFTMESLNSSSAYSANRVYLSLIPSIIWNYIMLCLHLIMLSYSYRYYNLLLCSDYFIWTSPLIILLCHMELF